MLLSYRIFSLPWQCSASCGQGYHRRLVSCSEVHAGNDNYEYGHQSLSNCPGTPPESYMPCSQGPCPPTHEWRVGVWGPVSGFLSLCIISVTVCLVLFSSWQAPLHLLFSPPQCSVSCGGGVMERTVQCASTERQGSDSCPSDTKPEASKVCSSPACE